ncbi:hypothetical protein FY557_03585 [Chryseobacterium sp. SN22]|uniref:hypothetical protein n=1 Tax=Chryseobacterium sp. SN22 TaxID=2606431 RepID=UPI0011EE8BC7|nr:hypothetical protein [Chryseobacterium sp. SN22]KAA0129803.1 hypothetical protein FY557_03585 [Chryseobacterium sp. SN22]
MKPKQIPGVPIQKKGGFHDSESTRPCTDSDADLKFDILKQRFFSINQWKSYAGGASADFRHFDSSGKPADRMPKKGDFIRIEIPGPGNSEGKGYDWVEIVNLSHRDTGTAKSYLMICRPCKEPNKLKGNIVHFYSSAATSNIMISKEGNTLKVGVYGRNETPNFNTGFLNKIRNLFIGTGGMFGFSKIHWKSLAEGLITF